MRVFISWSGDLSRRVASILHKFLPCMLQDVDAFMSKHDIESGARWSAELTRELEESSFGIICLTPDNLKSVWLHFEAGALTKHVEGRACCLLLGGLSHADVGPPLSQFQNRPFSVDECRALLRDVNSKLERPLDTTQLDLVFDKWWPDLDRESGRAISESARSSQPFHRSERDILEELLLHVRRFSSAPPGTRQETEPGDLLERPVGYDSLSWYTLWKFPGTQISEHWQRRLLQDLDSARYPTIGDLDAAINKARGAVEAYKKENPEWFKYGTDYVTKALGFVDEDFRRRHGFAQRTLEAFERLSDIVEKGGDG